MGKLRAAFLKAANLGTFSAPGWYSVHISSMVAPLVTLVSGAASLTLEGEAELRLEMHVGNKGKALHETINKHYNQTYALVISLNLVIRLSLYWCY